MVNSALKIYTRALSAVGATVLIYGLAIRPETPLGVLDWLVLSGLAILFGIHAVSVTALDATISVSDTLFIATSLLFGPGPAMLAVAADSFVLSYRMGHSWDRLAFNTFVPSLSLGTAGFVFIWMSGLPPALLLKAPLGRALLPLVVLVLIYGGLNAVLAAIAVQLESRRPIGGTCRKYVASLVVSYASAASTALCTVMVVRGFGIAAVLIIVPILSAFYWTLHASAAQLQAAEKHISELDRLFTATVETVAMTIDAKNGITHDHVVRVQQLAATLARELKVTDESTLRALSTAALLHDTGKIAIPDHILNKPGPLTPAEFEQMKTHVEIGATILSFVPFPYPLVPIVRCHHENWDGSGYPRGLSGDAIPIGARILSVADCFDALTSDRPYRPKMAEEAALAIITARRGNMYDPVVVDTFMSMRSTLRAAAASHNQQAETLRRLLAHPAQENDA